MTSPLDDLLTGLGLDPVVPASRVPPTFTVVIRTQGRRPGSLGEAVASVTAQSHPAHEIIVVVHGAPAEADTVRSMLNPVPGSALQVLQVEGGGRARPLNTGLDAASGAYVCALDDDDLAEPDWLAAFARAAVAHPGRIVRAVTVSQAWTTDGGEEPVRAVGPVQTPFDPEFDYLAHLSDNRTPICSLAFPRAGLAAFGLRFDDTLPVFEDWDLLMRAAPVLGVVSIPDRTTLYRRLDHGNADTAVEEAAWHETHARVLASLSARPLLLPAGSAGRVASAHFVPGGGSRHEHELEQTRAELDAVTRSPLRWAARFGRRGADAARRRLAARRP